MTTLLNRRVLAILLALVMVLGAFGMVSCADDTQEEPDVTDDDQDLADDEKKDEGEARLPLDLPAASYNGKEVHFLEWSCGGQDQAGESWIPWEEIAVDDYDGDLLNSAIYDRNSSVEETYDVTITKEYMSIEHGYVEAVRNNNTTGDNAYQVITLRTTNISTLVFENIMANMYEMENLHTEMPWWNQDSVRSYTLGSNLFFAAPELLVRDKGATACMFFNNTVAADHEIKDLYGFEANAIVSMHEVVEHLHNRPYNGEVVIDDTLKAAIDAYYEQYGAK